MAMPRHISAFVLCFSVFFIANCGKKDTELVGFHKYEFGKTTKKDGVACSKRGQQTYCSHNDSPSIAGHKTQTDLYFRGHDEDSPLAEILVGIWKCNPGELSAGLYAQMGEPAEKVGQRLRWEFKNMTAIAILKEDKGLCTLHFLDHSEEKRIAKLFPRSNAEPVSDEADSTKK